MADFEEFSIGNMHPVVQPDQILSKNEDVEDNSVKKGIAEEFEESSVSQLIKLKKVLNTSFLKLDNINKICSVLGCSIGDLLTTK